jgi:protein gp37
MGSTGIEWCEAVWNPVVGCSMAGVDCKNCYAMRMAARLQGRVQGYEGVVRDGKWTGRVNVVKEKLMEPLHWRAPRQVFVNSMSDLFHEDVDRRFVDLVHGVMALCSQHRFMILTKRTDRAAQYLGAPDVYDRVAEELTEGYVWDLPERTIRRLWNSAPKEDRWPLKNVVLGASAGNQEMLEKRIGGLLAAPAARRIVSLEPLLGPIDLTAIGDGGEIGATYDALRGGMTGGAPGDMGGPRLDGVIVGGESGPGARPCDVEWIRGIVRQCRAAGVAVFVKQLGAVAIDSSRAYCEFTSLVHWECKARSWLGGISGGGMRYKKSEGCVCIDAKGRICRIGKDFMRAEEDGAYPVKACHRLAIEDRKGGEMGEWPEDLRVRENVWG